MKIQFSDFWKGWHQEDFITPILKRHFSFELSDSPDILFCSTLHRMRNANQFSCPKIVYAAENHVAKGKGDYTFGFSDPSQTHYYFPHWMMYMLLNPAYKEMLKESRDMQHSHFCAAAISNTGAIFRNYIFDKLHEYKEIKSYGAYRNNTEGLPPRAGNWHDGKINFFLSNPHKFMLACENSITNGYLTEKLLDAFLCKSIPIYAGDPHAGEWFNQGAFINALNPGWIEKIIELDNDSKRFKEMLLKPVFTNEEKVSLHIENFEIWLVEKIKELTS
jgi:alpha(1,3/1,4) fucosyltransferase